MALRKEANRNTLSSFYYGSTGTLGGNSSSTKAEPMTAWLTTSWLCDWFCQGDTLPLALGDVEVLRMYGLEDTHIEILKRLEGILLLLADKNMLQVSHLNLIWKNITSHTVGAATVDAHARVIFKLLMLLATKLSKELILHLLLKIERIPRPLEEYHLEYLQVLTENAAYCQISEDVLERNVFSVLWHVLLGTGNESISVLNTTAHTFAILLSKLKSDVLIMKYLKSSLHIISDGKITSNITIQFILYIL